VKTVPIKANILALAWLSGIWQADHSQGWTEEFWSTPKDNVLLGTARFHDQTGLLHTDLTWIVEEDQKIHSHFRRYDNKFRPYPHLIEPIRFDLVELKENYAVFYCTEPDTDAWMIYERNSSTLIGTFIFGSNLEVMTSYSLSLSPTASPAPV